MNLNHVNRTDANILISTILFCTKALIEVEGMKVVNKDRESRSMSPAYDGRAFFAVADSLELACKGMAKKAIEEPYE